jgi:DNA-binding response OmpR family regulator
MPNVLLVDDDQFITEIIKDYLEQCGHFVGVVHDGKAGVTEALSGKYAIAILDISMPKMDGIEVLRRVRAKSNIPVLIITHKGEHNDRVLGLELGADDYVVKPCTPREVAARIKAILGRAQRGQPSVALINLGKLVLNAEAHTVEWDGVPIYLTDTEFKMLRYLAEHAGYPVTKRELSEMVLGKTYQVFDRAVDVHISKIRRKLAQIPGSDGKQIKTLNRVGYKL